MYPYVHIFGYDIASYSLMFVIGCLISFSVILWRGSEKGLRVDDQLYFIAFILLGALAGAKLVYLLLNLRELWTYRSLIFENWISMIRYLRGGFVFYGGLLGGCVGAFCYAGHFSVDTVRLAENFVIGIPLFHCFGRIGCFLAGCCYGVEYHGIFSVVYTESLSAQNGVSYLPVQPIEAGVNLMIFSVLLCFEKKDRKPLQNFGIYAILYGMMRFLLEFLRGDVQRGFLGPLSASQWISLLIILPLGIYMYFMDYDHNLVIQKLLKGKDGGNGFFR